MSQLNQDYVTKWVEWFLVEQDKQGMEREVRDSLEQCLGMFFASQAAFDLHTANVKMKPKLIMDTTWKRGRMTEPMHPDDENFVRYLLGL